LLAFGIFDASIIVPTRISILEKSSDDFFSGSTYFVFRLISRFVASSLSICFWISSSSILAKAIPLRQFGVQSNLKFLKLASSSSGFISKFQIISLL
jgi:hypothetical protein